MLPREGWYAKTSNGEVGPLSWTSLTELVRDGQLAPQDRIWFPGSPNWIEASEADGLFRPPADDQSSKPTLTLEATEPQKEPAHSDLGVSKTAPASEPAIAHHNNWFARHWRGELSLPISYWLNGFLANIGVVIVVAAISVAIESTYSPPLILSGLITTWLTVGIILVWQVVGVWRSATRADLRRRSVWPAIAKILICLGIARSIGSFGTDGIPQISDAVDYMRGDPEWGARGLRVLRNGSEIEIVGNFAAGLETEFHQALERAPGVRVIHLNSAGGRIGVARQIRDEISNRGLDTYVARECTSACTIAFLGGKARWLAPDAKLGFHLGKFGGQDYSEGMQDAYSKLPKQFVDHVLATPSSEVWYPSSSELIRNGVATAVAPVGYFAFSGGDLNPTPSGVETRLLSTPVYRALRSADSEAWNSILAAWSRVILEGFPETQATQVVHTQILKAVSQRKSIASDGAVFDLTTVLLREMKIIQSKDPEACWSYVFAGTDTEIRRFLPSDLQEADIAAETRLLSDPVVEPVKKEDRERLMANVVQALRSQGKDAKQILTDIGEHANHAAACPALINIYQAAMSLPPADAASAMRYLYEEN